MGRGGSLAERIAYLEQRETEADELEREVRELKARAEAAETENGRHIEEIETARRLLADAETERDMALARVGELDAVTRSDKATDAVRKIADVLMGAGLMPGGIDPADLRRSLGVAEEFEEDLLGKVEALRTDALKLRALVAKLPDADEDDIVDTVEDALLTAGKIRDAIPEDYRGHSGGAVAAVEALVKFRADMVEAIDKGNDGDDGFLVERVKDLEKLAARAAESVGEDIAYPSDIAKAIEEREGKVDELEEMRDAERDLRRRAAELTAQADADDAGRRGYAEAQARAAGHPTVEAAQEAALKAWREPDGDDSADARTDAPTLPPEPGDDSFEPPPDDDDAPPASGKRKTERAAAAEAWAPNPTSTSHHAKLVTSHGLALQLSACVTLFRHAWRDGLDVGTRPDFAFRSFLDEKAGAKKGAKRGN